MNSENYTDDQIREVLQHAYHQGSQPAFLQSYAAAVLQAPPADFLSMRSASVCLINRYQLWRYLMGERPPISPPMIEGEVSHAERKRKIA